MDNDTYQGNALVEVVATHPRSRQTYPDIKSVRDVIVDLGEVVKNSLGWNELLETGMRHRNDTASFVDVEVLGAQRNSLGYLLDPKDRHTYKLGSLVALDKIAKGPHNLLVTRLQFEYDTPEHHALRVLLTPGAGDQHAFFAVQLGKLCLYADTTLYGRSIERPHTWSHAGRQIGKCLIDYFDSISVIDNVK